MKCPQCQTENKDGAKFCNECGLSFANWVEPAQKGDSLSGKADPREALKAIPLVEEKTEEFDFSEAEVDEPFAPDSAFTERDSVKDVARDMFPSRFDMGRNPAVRSAGADQTADLTGLEKLVDSSYVPPAYSGRAGDTIEMPPVGDSAKQSRQFRAQLSDKERKQIEKAKRKEEGRGKLKLPLVLALVTLLAAAGIAFGTYYLEMWGGKSIPNVIGQSQENAEFTLESKGFLPRAELVKSDDVAGMVLLTDPAPGARAEQGAEVVIHVSTSRIVPVAVGRMQSDVEADLKAEGFDNFAFAPVKSNEPEGTVLSINVESGERALSTTPIELEVAVPFTIPEVKDLSEKEAIEKLEAEGYVVTVRPHYTEESKEGLAVSTEPAAGTEHKSGEAVTLYVTKSRGSELTSLTWSYLTSQSNFSLDGLSYEVSSVDAVEFVGDNTVQYTLTARYYETHYWFGFEAETRYGDYETITGTITWNDANEISAADPTIQRI